MDQLKIFERTDLNGQKFYTGYVIKKFIGFKIKTWYQLHVDGWPPLPDLTIFKFNRSWRQERELVEYFLKSQITL